MLEVLLLLVHRSHLRGTHAVLNSQIKGGKETQKVGKRRRISAVEVGKTGREAGLGSLT
jgi:hypothetical protein